MGSEGQDEWAEVVGFEGEKRDQEGSRGEGKEREGGVGKGFFFWGGPKLWRNAGLQTGKRVEMGVSS